MARGNQGRVRARRCAVQALYQWLLAGQPSSEIIKEFVADRELINVDREYFSTLTTRVIDEQDQLVADIEPKLDRDWAQIDPVEKCILLIGAFELRYQIDIPWKAVVNESIELCKMFGSEEAHKYINGVLDKLAREKRCDEMLA